MIAHLPPIKAISPYCLHLTRELAKKVDLEIIGFQRLQPEGLYDGGTTEKGTEFEGIENADIKNIIYWYNPLSWIKAGLKADGDIVHIQHWAQYSTVMYCIILPVLKLKRKTIVLTIHNITPHTNNKSIILIDKILNTFVFPFSHHFIVHNQRNKEKLMKLYHIDEKRISIITHGVLKPENVRHISKINARTQLNIPMDKKVILYFGYIWRYKGLDTLLESLTLIKKSIQNVLLLIVGEPVKFQNFWVKCEKIISDHNLRDYVITKLEYIPESEVGLYFSASDLVVLPYREPFDTHGGVGALSLSYKKPLVVTDIGGLPEYVKDEKVISSPNDANGLADNIIKVLKDEKLLKKLSKDSEQLSHELAWDVIADKTVDLYNNLIAGRNRS